MVNGETHAFGSSTLDLSNHYYGGSEADAEKFRFVQYCESKLGESAANGKISSQTFLNVLQKYCYYRNMRGSVCLAAESLTFESLPSDVQLAFVNKRCEGLREDRLTCLEKLTQQNSDILVPDTWKFGICSATYPLAVSYDTSTASFEEHTFSTELGRARGSSFAGNGDNPQPSTTSQVIFDNSDLKKTTQKTNHDKSDVFKKPSSYQSGESELQTRSGESLPTAASSESSKKGGMNKKKATYAPSLRKTSPPAVHKSAPPSFAPTLTPQTEPIGSVGSGSIISTTAAPTLMPTRNPGMASISTNSPSWTPDYTSHSVMDSSSIVPITPSKSSRAEENPSGWTVDWTAAAVFFFGMLFIPVLFLFFVKVHQRRSGRRGPDPGLLDMEDFSVVSENSAILVAMGAKFKRSDEYSDSDDIESNDSIFLINQTRGMTQRIRQAFSRMYEYIDDEASRNNNSYPQMDEEDRVETPSIRETSSKCEIPPIRETSSKSETPTVRMTSSKSEFEVFRPNASSSSEETIGILKIDAGTMLLPSDDIYVNEFSRSDEDDYDSPVIYHRPAAKTKQVNFQDLHPGSQPADDEPPESLASPLPLMRNPRKHPMQNVPVPPCDSCTSDSTQGIQSKAIHVDVLREEKTDNNFRIVGLAYESYPSDETEEGAQDDSTQSSQFREEGELPRLPSYRVALEEPVMNPRSIMSPGTFQELSRELDDLVAGGGRVGGRRTPATVTPSPPANSTSAQLQPSNNSRRSHSADYNLVSRISSLSHSTASTLSDMTPIVGNTMRWPRNTYVLDVLGEQCSQRVPSRGHQHIRSRSWQSDSESETPLVEIDRLSLAPSTSSSSRDDGVETMLSDGGGVTCVDKKYLRGIT